MWAHGEVTVINGGPNMAARSVIYRGRPRQFCGALSKVNFNYDPTFGQNMYRYVI